MSNLMIAVSSVVFTVSSLLIGCCFICTASSPAAIDSDFKRAKPADADGSNNRPAQQVMSLHQDTGQENELHRACRNGDLNAVKQLLHTNDGKSCHENKNKYFTKTKDGKTPLFYLANAKERIENLVYISEVLENCGVTVTDEVKDADGHTAAYYAVKNGHFQLALSELLKHYNSNAEKANSVLTSNGRTFSHVIAEQGVASFFNRKHWTSLFNASALDANNEVPMCLAVRNAKFDQVGQEFFHLKKTGDCSYHGHRGSFLHTAAFYGRSDFVDLFWNDDRTHQPADNNEQKLDDHNVTALHAFVLGLSDDDDKNPKIVERLFSDNSLHLAVINFDVESKSKQFIKYLVESKHLKYDRNIQNQAGQTAVHLAVEYNRPDAIDVFFANAHWMANDGGLIDLSVRDRNGLTPLMYAIEVGNEEMAEDMVSRFVNLNKTAYIEETTLEMNDTILHQAVRNNMTKLIGKIMAANKAMVERRNNDGRVALFDAVEYQLVGVVGTLLDNGSPVTDTDDLGRSVLHLSLPCDQLTLEIVDLLLKPSNDSSASSLLSRRDRFGTSPVEDAISCNCYKLVDFYINNYNVSCHGRNVFGQTPLQVARMFKHRKLERLMLRQRWCSDDDSSRANNDTYDSHLENIIRCGSLPVIGNVSSRGLTKLAVDGFFSSYSFECKDGFVVSGSHVVTCNSLEQPVGWRVDGYCARARPRDCQDIATYMGDGAESGTYTIYPSGSSDGPLRVYCEMSSGNEYGIGGGWTVIQQRFSHDPSWNEETNWQEMETGFERRSGDFFLGAQKIHQIAAANNNNLSSSYYVLIEFRRRNRTDEMGGYGLYETFAMAGADHSPKYLLSLGKYVCGRCGGGNDQDDSMCKRSENGYWWYNGETETAVYDSPEKLPFYNSGCTTYNGGWWGGCNRLSIEGMTAKYQLGWFNWSDKAINMKNARMMLRRTPINCIGLNQPV